MKKQVNRKSKCVAAVIYAYLLLPVFIFAAGWLRGFLAVLVCVALLASYVLCIKNDTFVYDTFSFRQNFDKLAAAFAVILFWVYLSGIGGMCYQNDDLGSRTSLYRALVEYDWPVVSADGRRGLIYYVGYWLPSAVVGKLFGYQAGYFFQAIWAALGIFIVYLLICIRKKKVVLWPLFLMIGFSGLDYVGWWFLNGKAAAGVFPYMEHLERWARKYQYSSMTTQLFWVFNQAVPAWVATAFLFVNRKNRSNMLLVTASLMLSATFPFVGLLPFAAYYMLKDFTLQKEDLKEVFSVNNIIGVVLVGGISFLYLIGNVSAGMISGMPSIGVILGAVVLAAVCVVLSGLPAVRKKCGRIFTAERMTGILMTAGILVLLCLFGKASAENVSGDLTGQFPLCRYLLFCVMEFGIYAVFAYKFEKRNPEFYLVVILCFVCPLIAVGSSIDFCMRASIPALFVLMMFLIDGLEEMSRQKDKLLIALAVVLCIGAVTPFNEIHRSVRNTVYQAKKGKTVLCKEVDVETELLELDNFSGERTDGFLWRYVLK